GVAAFAVAFQFQANPLMSGAALVAQYFRSAAVVDQHDIEIAVAVDVGKGTAAADDRVKQVGSGGLLRHRLEASFLSSVPEQLGALAKRLVGKHLGNQRLEMAIRAQ